MELMSGNEAIAQGAWEAGCTIGVAYPGTPSTETLEAFAKKEGVTVLTGVVDKTGYQNIILEGFRRLDRTLA